MPVRVSLTRITYDQVALPFPAHTGDPQNERAAERSPILLMREANNGAG
jgi:hypothetical protein